jgi:hypothetical protein
MPAILYQVQVIMGLSTLSADNGKGEGKVAPVVN